MLLVDDDPDIRRILALLFERAGMAVTQAADGIEALKAAEAAVPDAIVADVQMPNMDGLELVHALHSRAESADVPVFLFSGKPPRAEMAHVLELDHVRFLSKGDPRKVIEALENLFGLDDRPKPASEPAATT